MIFVKIYHNHQHICLNEMYKRIIVKFQCLIYKILYLCYYKTNLGKYIMSNV